jgi:hypothetical protein
MKLPGVAEESGTRLPVIKGGRYTKKIANSVVLGIFKLMLAGFIRMVWFTNWILY